MWGPRDWVRGIHRQRGSTTVEYAVVGMFVIVALLFGPNVIQLIWKALQQAYSAFYYAISAAL